VFDATTTLDMTEEGIRHLFLEIGPTTVLHPFQILDGPPLPEAPGTMFRRGRLDHFALSAPSQDFPSFDAGSKPKPRPTETSATRRR